MRLKSTAVWYDLPGVEAAYMPIGAPSAVDALMNVGHTDALGNHRMAGRYTATPGVAPTWSASTGLTFNGTTQWLNTGILSTGSMSVIARYSNATQTDYRALFGAADAGTEAVGIFNWYGGNTITYVYHGVKSVASAPIAGVMGITSLQGYRNGVADGTAFTPTWTAPGAIFRIGAYGAFYYYFGGNIQSFLLASRILSPAEMWLASRQMAYCEQNPDWNAWARRRRYYYAPSAAAGRVGIYGRRGAVALPGGVSIRGGNHG